MSPAATSSHLSQQPEETEVRQYYIKEDKFELLRECQQFIFNETQVSPAIRKIVNDLITIENLETFKKQFLAVMK